MNIRSNLSMQGKVSMRVTKANGPGWRWRLANAQYWLPGRIKLGCALAIARYTQLPVLYGTLEMCLVRANGEIVNYRTVSHRVITTAFVNNLAANMVAVASPAIQAYTYHATGTGSTAEAIGNTALAVDSGVARVNGTQSNPSANVYRSVATITYASSLSITEHGVFSAVTAGTLLDRSVFSPAGVSIGDSITFTYSLTIAAGG